uniref:Splicing factor 45 n=1 Tax=Elaeophora elaphi TaxID=1147741 RepID=A0A0R3S508_9BILA
MSLYEIFGEDPVHEKGDDGRASKKETILGLSSALRLLQSQIHIKKTQLAQQRTVITPVVDLTAKSRSPKTTFLRPHKAMPLGDGPPLSFIPKALKEDKVFLFGEVLVEDEEHQEEIAKRTAGAAIAPPKILMEEDSKVELPTGLDASSTTSEMPPPSFIPSFGAGKGLGVAANIMTKFGYKEGAGLGRSGQGMSTALKVERLGKNSGVIVNEHELSTRVEASASPPPLPAINVTPAVNMTEALKRSSRILLLRNMVSPNEIDDQLEPEVKDEMKKYGQVNKVIIFRLLQVSDDEAVRIFIEFTNIGQAIKAFVDLNGRFFGGRSIKASFYDLEAYNANQFDR